jgi:hypothetical protein
MVLLVVAASIDYRALNVTQFSNLSTVSIISGAPFTNSFIKDLTGVLSFGSTARALYDGGGVTESLNWDTRLAKDASGVNSLTYGLRRLIDATATTSIDWDLRLAKDASNQNSIKYNDRVLADSVGVTSLDWQNKTFTGSAWVFLSITNHNDVSSGAFASGNAWGYDGVTAKWTNGPPTVTSTAKITTNNVALTLRDPMIGDGNNGAATTNKTAFLQLFGSGGLVKIATNDASSLTNFALLTNSITMNFDGATATIPTNLTRYVTIPYDCTVTGFTMLTDVSSLTVVDVMRCTYAEFDAGSTHPVIADKITASLPPTIGNSLYKTNVTSVGTWSASLTNGNVVAFRLITNTAATTITLSLKVEHALQ